MDQQMPRPRIKGLHAKYAAASLDLYTYLLRIPDAGDQKHQAIASMASAHPALLKRGDILKIPDSLRNNNPAPMPSR